MKNKFIIIGNGVAGMEAAKTIREHDAEAFITIISKETDLFYYRPRLIEYLASKVEFDEIVVYKKQWYIDKKIECILGKTVKNIIIDKKTVVLDDGEELGYDKLLIASGSNPFILPVEGNCMNGVFTIKNKEDVDKIIDYCIDIKNVVVVGGGLLGIETANSLKEKGLEVTIVEYADRILPRQIDKEGSSILENMLKQKRLRFLLGEEMKEIVGDGKLKQIILKSGKVIDTDAIIFSVGIRPIGELAIKAGLEFDKGIVVDEYMKTSKKMYMPQEM
ncbi:MAG: hypothetical protein A2Y24_06305 [Clostridiales bacterium GWE2_32_10]|nr:MAG: hypothetical protein A2Y24_06305 [Clostridiales bacterium GWE2_32_10]